MRSGVRTSQRIIRFGLTLLLCALAVQAPGASAQGIDDNASDAGHELPPAERQALLDAQASPPNAPQGNAVGDCDIGQWTPVEPINTARSRSGAWRTAFQAWESASGRCSSPACSLARSRSTASQR